APNQSDFGFVESVGQQREGDNYFFIVTISNLRRRSTNDLNFRLRWSWDGDSDFDNQDTNKKVDKKSAINAIFVSAFRDDCNPNEIKITSNANVACNKSGFKYTITIQKSSNANFSSPTTLVDKRAYESANSGSAIVTEITDNTAGQVYFKSIIEYSRTITTVVPGTFPLQFSTSDLVYQTVESVITPVQQFSVAPPALSTVSKDNCNNKINVKWQYNAAEANKFNIYRSSSADTYLQFDGSGDYIEVLNSTNISPATTQEMTIEAWVRVDKIGASQTIVQNGSFFYL
ncbi:MAG: hypothetical protein HC912_10145, partial [Saprospiraceae bacterium]|nr:hypothetical protein [Saprospiraceae bacterium]